MEKYALEAIGLTKSEVDVYLALLELGSTSTGKIVERSGTASSKIYEILDKLVQKGLVSFVIKSGVKHFEATPAQRILDYIKEKEITLQTQKESIQKIMPELEIRQKLAKNRSEATIYKGMKGGESAFRLLLDSMRPQDEWLAYTIAFQEKKYFDMITKIHRERSERGLKARIIFNEIFRNEAQTERNLAHTKIKFITDPQKTPAVVNIVNDKVLLNIMTEDTMVIFIENQELANAFRSQFEQLWNQDTLVVTGWDALRTELDRFLNELKYNDEEYLALGAAFGPKDHEQKYIEFFSQNAKKRMHMGIRTRLLYEKDVEQAIKKKEKGYIETAQYKFLPYKTGLPVAILPAKESTLIIIQKEIPTAIRIENKELADYFKQNFETLWKIAK